MKWTLPTFGAMALALSLQPASAADLPARMAVKAPPPAPLFTWSGSYIGVQAGGLWGRHDINPTATPIAPVGLATGFGGTGGEDSAFIGGFQTGYRWQRGMFVFGIEQDWRWTDLRTGYSLGAAPAGAPVFIGAPAGTATTADAFSSRVNWLADTRLQLGIAWDRTLLYAAGGLSTASMDTTASLVDPLAAAGFRTVTDEHKYHFGWNIGAGLEWAFSDWASLGVDYRFTRLEGETYNLGAVVRGGVTSQITADSSFEGHQIVGRLNIKTNVLTGLFGF
jgi:outer membrane immunogenic protein